MVELPRLPWWLILHGIILNTRPAKSAAKYAQIWTDEGSPLLVHTKKQAILLRGLLGGARLYRRTQSGGALGHALRPAVDRQDLDQLVAEGYGRVLVVPLYPQYARSTTASVEDALAHWQQRNGNGEKLALRSLPSFPENEGYIAALATAVRRHWQQQGRALRDERLLVMSFHGIPQPALNGEIRISKSVCGRRSVWHRRWDWRNTSGDGTPPSHGLGGLPGCNRIPPRRWPGWHRQGRAVSMSFVGLRGRSSGDTGRNRHREQGRVSGGRVGGRFTTFPVSTNSRNGSRRWPIWCSRVWWTGCHKLIPAVGCSGFAGRYRSCLACCSLFQLFQLFHYSSGPRMLTVNWGSSAASS